MANSRIGNFNKKMRYLLITKYPKCEQYIREQWIDHRWKVQYRDEPTADIKATILEEEIRELFMHDIDEVDESITFEPFDNSKIRKKTTRQQKERKEKC